MACAGATWSLRKSENCRHQGGFSKFSNHEISLPSKDPPQMSVYRFASFRTTIEQVYQKRRYPGLTFLRSEHFLSLRNRASAETEAMIRCFEEARALDVEGELLAASALRRTAKQHQANMHDYNKEAADWIYQSASCGLSFPRFPAYAAPRAQRQCMWSAVLACARALILVRSMSFRGGVTWTHGRSIYMGCSPWKLPTMQKGP